MTELPSDELNSKWSPEMVKKIIEFCQGRCENFVKDKICPAAGDLQMPNAFYGFCWFAAKDGIKGNLHRDTFIPTSNS